MKNFGLGLRDKRIGCHFRGGSLLPGWGENSILAPFRDPGRGLPASRNRLALLQLDRVFDTRRFGVAINRSVAPVASG